LGKPFNRAFAFFLLASSVYAVECFAFEVPLTSQTIREAYFLGQHHDASTDEALKPYLHKLTPPEKGPYIADIRLLTPYAQVIEASNSQGSGYSAQQASADYHARGDTIVVRFQIRFTPTYNFIRSHRDREHERERDSQPEGISVRPESFWQSFKTGLSQNGHWIEPLSREGEPIYVADAKGTGSMLDGAYIWLTFDAQDISSDTATAEILTPDGQHVTSDFDLATLR
jgi:hypothetical protein